MPKFFIKTYGCQMNERDSEQVAHSLVARGYQAAMTETEADVVLLNTCSVRDMAEQKALGKMGMLGQLAKRRPEVVFGFLGCMAQARGASLFKNLPHVDLVVGTQKFHRVADYVEDAVERKSGRTLENAQPASAKGFGVAGAHLSRRSESEGGTPNPPSPWTGSAVASVQRPIERRMDDLRFSIVDIGEEPGSQETIRDHQIAPRQATAFVSIMQGCNMHCTFCIVPQTRGAERSRSLEEIVREVRELVARGVKEVTLLGQIVNLYGRHEFPWRNFPSCDSKNSQVGNLRHSPFVQLLEAVHEIDGLERLRFTSPHPIGFRDDLLRALAELPKLAEHVHLPLQSGSNRILKAMHRTYTAEKYLALVERIRETRPEIAITTDVIVGFPGEAENDYMQTRDLVEQVRFDNAFIFRYSTRCDTPAAEMPDQVSERIKEDRNQDLLVVINESARRANERLVGRDVEILCEGPSRTNATRLMGRTRTNKIVVFEGAADYVGKIFNVRVQQANGFSLYGTPVMQL